MKIFHLIFSLLCAVSCALCAGSSSDRFEKYQSLSPLGPLDLDDSLYEDIISKPHDYHVAVLLTATESRFGCILCREFQPEWDLIARSWNRGSQADSPRLLFGSLDFSNGKGTFQKVRILQQCSSLTSTANQRKADAPNGTCATVISPNCWPACQS